MVNQNINDIKNDVQGLSKENIGKTTENIKLKDVVVEKNMLKKRAKKADDITDEMWERCNKINRDLVDEFFDLHPDFSVETCKQYTSCLHQFFYYIYTEVNDKPYYEVTKRDFMKFMAYLQKRGLSTSARALRKAACSSLCNYVENILAEELEECKMFRNFTKGLPPMERERVYDRKPVTKEEFEKMSAYLLEHEKYEAYAWLYTAYYTAARRAEIIQFKKEIVDYVPKEGTNYVTSHYVRGKGKSETGKPLQYLISLEVIKAWKLWLEHRPYESEYIFTTRVKGEVKPVGKSWADKLCENTLSKICGRRINPHLFKATAVTRMLEEGVDLKIVSQKIAHHNDVSTTANFYDLRTFEDEMKDLFK